MQSNPSRTRWAAVAAAALAGGCVAAPPSLGPQAADPVMPALTTPGSDLPPVTVNTTPSFPRRIQSVDGDVYIVVLESGRAGDVASAHGLKAGRVFTAALNGFTAAIPAGRLEALARDPRVAYFEPDQPIYPHTHESVPQVPTGIRRSQGTQGRTANTNFWPAITYGSDANDAAWSHTVCVIDSGIWADHPELNVVGGANCLAAPCSEGAYVPGESFVANDGYGHGTHVAGIIGARDNVDGSGQMVGVVGMAPGIGLWAVKVFNDAGSGTVSQAIAGVDWVTANGAAHGIKVVNMSLGSAYLQSFNAAVQNSITAGFTYVVSAGNDNKDVSRYSPASVGTAMTIASLNDTDGAPGSVGSKPIAENGDDQISKFSNFGNLVDLAAPGLYILSTYLPTYNGGYKSMSGTSMAAPHVTGAAAIYLHNNPGAQPGAVGLALKTGYTSAANNSETALSVVKGQAVTNVNSTTDWNGLVVKEGGYKGTKGTWNLLWARNL